MRKTLFLALAMGALIACGPSYRDVQQVDTIEAYESFIAAKPSDPNATMAKIRLEELYLDAARETATLEAYDTYLAKYKDDESAVHMETALTEREDFMYKQAEATNTPAAWQAYLDEYPKGQKAYKSEARRRIAVGNYLDQIEQGPVELEAVNLAENPDGPLNGWLITADFVNNGDRTIKSLGVLIEYLDGSGNAIESKKWPLCAPKAPGNMPIEEEWKQPVKPGETRMYTYMDTAPDAAGWAKKVRLTPISITFVEDEAGD